MSAHPGPWRVVEWMGPRFGLQFAVRRDVFGGTEHLKDRAGARKVWVIRDAAARAAEKANAKATEAA